VVLIDAHSVASRANLVHGELTSQIYLGDRDGRSCDAWLVDAARQSFEKAGFQVVCNAPYKGGYITEHYGSMDKVDALQIEMCERVYMDRMIRWAHWLARSSSTPSNASRAYCGKCALKSRCGARPGDSRLNFRRQPP